MDTSGIRAISHSPSWVSKRDEFRRCILAESEELHDAGPFLRSIHLILFHPMRDYRRETTFRDIFEEICSSLAQGKARLVIIVTMCIVYSQGLKGTYYLLGGESTLEHTTRPWKSQDNISLSLSLSHFPASTFSTSYRRITTQLNLFV